MSVIVQFAGSVSKDESFGKLLAL